MSATGSSVIDCRDLSFSYGEAPVLDHVDLSVQRGEFLGIVGPNAGGKSTLLKLILGQLKPQSGGVRVLGMPPQLARQRLGYVAQHPSFSRDFPISVEQVVLMGTLARAPGTGRWGLLLPGRYSRADREHAARALVEVEAADLAKRQIGSLSGGQLQRVMLARAIASDPDILLLDEPTANIDQRMENDIFDLLKTLNRRMTILVVSHDIAFISSYVTRVACINRTLVCHHTDAIDSDIIQQLYGDHVRMVHHRH